MSEPGAVRAQSPPRADDRVYRLESYVPLVGSSFGLRVPAGDPVEAELVEASAHAAAGRCFSLRFLAPGGAPLAQRSYDITHPALGAFSLFLVPLGPSDGRQQLQAIVNRLPDLAAPGE